LARKYFPGGVMAVEGEYPTRESATRTLVTGAGIPLADAVVMHLNNQYVRRGELDVHHLFTHESVWSRIIRMQDDIPERLMEFREMLADSEPKISMGCHCTSPYSCDFQNYCQGLLPLSASDSVEEEVSSPVVDHEAIHGWLNRFGYPLYFLDFETIMPAIPLFNESRPYQQIPFQYSLHYLSGKGEELVHSEYLAHPSGDPRPDLIRKLIADTREPGNILAYSARFEASRLREPARDFPEYSADLADILSRLDDLALVFQRKSFHFPHLGRKYSIKRILPLLVPDLSYNDLEINNGGDASAIFEQLYHSADSELIENTCRDLLKYCHLDTLAMVRILIMLKRMK
jgi:hypothetical protein